MAILKKINFGNGAHDIAKTIVTAKSNGVMSVAAPNGVTNGDNEQANYQYELDVNIDGTTLVKSTTGEGQQAVTKLAVGTVPAAQVSVVDESGKLTATNVEAALAELDDKITSTGNVAKKYKVVSVDSPAGTSLAEYKLQVAEGTSETYADVTGSANIVVPKDQHLKNVVLVNQRPAEEGESGPVSGNFLKFTYVLNNGTESDVYVDVSAFLSESEFGDGLEVSNAGVVSVKLDQGLEFGGETGENQSIKVKIDSTSSDAEKFLSVGANGVKISGVQDAINNAIEALDVTDAAVDGQVVTAVSETDGKVSSTKADFAGIKLGGFTQDTSATGEIASTDTLAAALNKLENKIDAAADDHTVVKHATNNKHVTVSGTPNDNGSTTYTVTEDDIASAQALTNEIKRAQDAEKEIAEKVGLTGDEGKRTFTSTTNYGAGSTSVVDNMQKLDTALNVVSVKVNAIQYKVTDTTLEFFGISLKTV